MRQNSVIGGHVRRLSVPFILCWSKTGCEEDHFPVTWVAEEPGVVAGPAGTGRETREETE